MGKARLRMPQLMALRSKWSVSTSRQSEKKQKNFLLKVEKVQKNVH
jgi:hypothetical protein